MAPVVWSAELSEIMVVSRTAAFVVMASVVSSAELSGIVVFSTPIGFCCQLGTSRYDIQLYVVASYLELLFQHQRLWSSTEHLLFRQHSGFLLSSRRLS